MFLLRLKAKEWIYIIIFIEWMPFFEDKKYNESLGVEILIFRGKGTRTWSPCQTPRTGDKYSKFRRRQGMFQWLTGLLASWNLSFLLLIKLFSMSDLDIRPDGTVRNVPAQDWDLYSQKKYFHFCQGWPLIGKFLVNLVADWLGIFIQNCRMWLLSWTLITASHLGRREVC